MHISRMPRRRAHFFSHAVSLVYRYRPLHRSRNFANSTAHNNGQQNSQQECRIDTRHTSRQRVRHVCYSPRAKRYEHTEAWSARAPIPLLYGQRTVEPCRKRYPLLWQHAGHFPEEGEEGERKCTGSGSGVLIYSRASRRPAFDAVFEPPSNTENSTGEMPPQTYHSIRIPSLSHLARTVRLGVHSINFTLPNRYASLSLVRKGQPEITIKLNMRGSGRHLQPAAFLLHHSH